MSKERLKIAIDIRNYIDGKGEFDEEVEVIDWLIEQVNTLEKCAARNKELEEELENLQGHWEHDTWQLAGEKNLREKYEQQNKRYRRSLKTIKDHVIEKNHEDKALILLFIDKALEGETE